MDAKIKYTLRRVTEDGLVKPVTKNFKGHKIPLVESFNSREEVMEYLFDELGKDMESKIYTEDIFVLPVLVPNLGDN
jgi:hypothetical protein